MSLHFLNIIVFSFLIYSPHSLIANNYKSTIISQDQNHVRVKFTFEMPGTEYSNGKVYSTYKKANYIYDYNGAKIPIISELIHLPGKNTSVTIISHQEETQTIENYLVFAEYSEKNELFNVLDIKYLGLYRDAALSSISILPVKVDLDNNILSWTKELIIEARTLSPNEDLKIIKRDIEEKTALKQSILNGDQSFYKNESLAASQQSTLAVPVFSSYSNIYKIKVNETGLYKVIYADLQDAEFPIDQVNVNNLALFNKGVEVPIFIETHRDGTFDFNDYFEFWGEINEKTFLNAYPDQYSDPFSDVNVYWLVEKNSSGLRLIEESGGVIVTNPANFVRATDEGYEEILHFEKNNHWQRFGNSPEYIDHPAYTYDHWFWNGIISAPTTRDYNFYLPHPYPTGSGVKVEAMFRGSNPIPGHQISLWLNQQPAGDVFAADGWRGDTKRKVTKSGLSQNNLHHGENTFRIIMSQTETLDIVLLNWFNITYKRKFRADKEFIKFKLPPNKFSDLRIKQFEIDGFNNSKIEIYKLGLSKIGNGKIDLFKDQTQFSSYRIIFQDHIFDPDVQYIALTEEAKKKPLSIEKYEYWKENNLQRSITDTDNSADVLIITTKIFESEALRLESLKEQKGFTVETILVDQIYDTFNFGIKSPLSIKEFFKYVYNKWDQSKRLRYVILAGDGSYDRKGVFGSSSDYIPVIMYSTNGYGAAPSDLQYSLISGDDNIPDISIGRIPASTITELANYIDKVDEYENTALIGSWKNKALFISGNDASGSDREIVTNKPIFRAQNSRLSRLKLPENVFSYKLNTVENDTITNGVDPEFGSTFELIDYMDEGVSFINFMGHGGGAIWADQVLFDLNDADNLNNSGKYPFVASMTCFTGAFENFSRIGLAEKLLFTENKGAIGSLASASIGWKYNDFAIEWTLLDYLWDDNFTFGMAVDFMKISYMASSVYYLDERTISTPGWSWQNNSPLWSSMINQYNFLGDPTLKLAKPAQKLAINISNNTPSSGEKIRIEIDASNTMQEGFGEIEISDTDNFKYLEQSFTLANGKHIIEFDIPQNRVGKLLKIKAYGSDNITDASAFNTLSIESSLISSVNIFPKNTQITDSITFQITANSYNPIVAMELRKFRNVDGTGNNSISVTMNKINDTLFISSEPIVWILKPGLSYFEIYVRDSMGKESIFDLQKLTIHDNRPDLAVHGNSVKYSGVDQLFLEFDVTNNSDSMLTDVLITSFAGLDTIPFLNDRFSFAANEEKTIKSSLTMNSFVESQQYTIRIDPLNEINEKSESNNNVSNKNLITDHILIDNIIGTSIDGSNNSSISLFQDWDFQIEPNVLSTPAVFSFAMDDISEGLLNNDQKDLNFIKLNSRSDSLAFKIVSPVSFIATLSVRIDNTIDNISFYKYDNFLNLWVKIGPDTVGNLIKLAINSNGSYAIFSSEDDREPHVEITANGRSLAVDRSNLVSLNPNIAILLQDENGIYYDSFSMSIDGEQVNPNDLVIPDTIINANSIAIMATPQLELGSHTLDLTVSDINNNTTSVNITFDVSSEAGFKVYGNYPNPFDDHTIISYENSTQNDLSEIKTRVYSVSGHLVRKKLLPSEEVYSDLLTVDYHEFDWDGTDDNGNQVANGVYFLVIEAVSIDGTGKKHSYKRKLKLARLR